MEVKPKSTLFCLKSDLLSDPVAEELDRHKQIFKKWSVRLRYIYIYIYIYILGGHTHTHTHTYIYIYIYILFSPVKPESGKIPPGQKNHSTMKISLFLVKNSI